MAIKTSAELKAYFETGDVPTQAQFIDLIDTIFNGETPRPKEYIVSLTQTSTVAPRPEVLINTFTGVLTWAYVSPGVYTLTSTAEFTDNKTVILCTQEASAFMRIFRTSANVITVCVYNGSFVGSDDVMTDVGFTIRVYP